MAADSLHPPALFTERDAWLAGAFAIGTAALMPLDQDITEEFRDPGPQHSNALQAGANDLDVVGNPGVLVANIALFGIGRVVHVRRMAELGLYGTEAIVVSGGVTALIKGLAGRARPAVDDNDPDSYVVGRGFGNGDFASLPSGHATAAFAAAAVVAAESARWWPHASGYIVPMAYGTATLVALSRVYQNRHWASDVMLGAGIGTLTGLAVVHFNTAHPKNPINRWLLGMSIAPDPRGGGALLAWTIHTR
ncbi:MAG TPA: phosphatase PAP2 family protein [Gemmatimonadaceae bacterium]|nr:phosphatase PAP2 family protein [Gemmatimonadaceae bacterium]